MQPGDVLTTYADASVLERDYEFVPKITLREGLRKFAEWYKEYAVRWKARRWYGDSWRADRRSKKRRGA